MTIFSRPNIILWRSRRIQSSSSRRAADHRLRRSTSGVMSFRSNRIDLALHKPRISIVAPTQARSLQLLFVNGDNGPVVLVAFHNLRPIPEFSHVGHRSAVDAAAAWVNLIEADSFRPGSRFEIGIDTGPAWKPFRAAAIYPPEDGHHSSEQRQPKAIPPPKGPLHLPASAARNPIAWKTWSLSVPYHQRCRGGDNPVQAIIRKCDRNAERTHQDRARQGLRPVLC